MGKKYIIIIVFIINILAIGKIMLYNNHKTTLKQNNTINGNFSKNSTNNENDSDPENNTMKNKNQNNFNKQNEIMEN